ncbi:MAG TPA: enoyl-CoA hydratase-related protein, partial [Kiloniellaceae bacterium]|nr:enoyl-CoA hydratase-related protein [Kiloniellaceae bacterium]
MADYILTESIGVVRRITLNRPDRLNAWNKEMRDELIAALDGAEAETAVRAIVLTGAGDRAFGAGQDLNESKG